MNHFMLHFDLLIQQNESMKQHVHLEENELWNVIKEKTLIVGDSIMFLNSKSHSELDLLRVCYQAIALMLSYFDALIISFFLLFTSFHTRGVVPKLVAAITSFLRPLPSFCSSFFGLLFFHLFQNFQKIKDPTNSHTT